MTAYADFRFASTGDLANLGGPASRFNHNITAIKLLKSLEAEGRAHGDLAPDEQRTLARYSGWGDGEVLNGFFRMALIRKQRLRGQMETLPAHLESVAREIAGHRKAIMTRDRNEHDEFAIELRRSGTSGEIITFTDRGRAGAHLRQLCFAVDRESRSRGAITRVIGRYRGSEIVARASGRQLDALGSLFSEIDLFLRAGESR